FFVFSFFYLFVFFFFLFFFYFFFFFFFQAEDGIRDFHVTGVQTCALPISVAAVSVTLVVVRLRGALRSSCACCVLAVVAPNAARSEERRVGKECRSRWWP